MTIYNHTNIDRIPYTYLIGWTKQNMWYYGVRYAKNCTPKDLWVSYFTSSKHVKKFINKHGNPDHIEIRRIFSEAKKALIWEQTVLRRFNVEKRNNFLNKKNSTTNSIIITENKTSFKKGNIPWNKNRSLKKEFGNEWTKRYSRIKSVEEKKVLSKKNKERFLNVEIRNIYSQQTKLQFQNPIKKEKHKNNCINHSNTIWINNGVNNKRIPPDTFLLYNGWKLGRLIPKKVKDKMKKNRKSIKDPLTGRFIKNDNKNGEK